MDYDYNTPHNYEQPNFRNSSESVKDVIFSQTKHAAIAYSDTTGIELRIKLPMQKDALKALQGFINTLMEQTE